MADYNQKVGKQSMTLGETIKYYRQLNELSQEELGRKINADARTISNYETEKYKPSADTIILLAKAFQISTDKLLIDSPYEEVKHLLEEKEWRDFFLEVASLSKEDRKLIKNLVDRLASRKKEM